MLEAISSNPYISNKVGRQTTPKPWSPMTKLLPMLARLIKQLAIIQCQTTDSTLKLISSKWVSTQETILSSVRYIKRTLNLLTKKYLKKWCREEDSLIKRQQCLDSSLKPMQLEWWVLMCQGWVCTIKPSTMIRSNQIPDTTPWQDKRLNLLMKTSNTITQYQASIALTPKERNLSKKRLCINSNLLCFQ